MITADKVRDMKEEFYKRMDAYMKTETNTIFTDDLKMVVNLVDTDDELNIAKKMINRYASQESLRVGVFQFGPVIMRMLHHSKKPDLALELFNNQTGFFAQMSSYLVLMDLLYEEGMYDKVLETFDKVAENMKQLDRFPRDCATLALAACYQQGTSESCTRAEAILSKCSDMSVDIPVRGKVYAALLSMQQGKPEDALEILTVANEQRFIAVLNVKAIAYAALNRAEDAVKMISSVLYEDLPDYVKSRRDIFPETIEAVEKVVAAANDTDLTNKFTTIKNDLTQKGFMSERKLHDFVKEKVMRSRSDKNSFKARGRSVVRSMASEFSQFSAAAAQNN